MRTPVDSGDKLDHYLVKEVVARSGTVSVFRGTDLDTNRQVAIKIPHPEMESDPTFFSRFRREEEIVKSLDHPGIMKVFAEDGRSQNYIVMEWFEGKRSADCLTGSESFLQNAQYGSPSASARYLTTFKITESFTVTSNRRTSWSMDWAASS